MPQWRYIKTNENPADYCTRGLEMERQGKINRWFINPEFLWRADAISFKKVNQYKVSMADKEVKTIEVKSTQITSDILSTLE